MNLFGVFISKYLIWYSVEFYPFSILVNLLERRNQLLQDIRSFYDVDPIYCSETYCSYHSNRLLTGCTFLDQIDILSNANCNCYIEKFDGLCDFQDALRSETLTVAFRSNNFLLFFV